MNRPEVRSRLALRAWLAITFGPVVALGSEFPAPFNSGPNRGKPALTPNEAVAVMKLPPGFKATVFAAEPDVQNPIGMAWDGRGRLYVAENYTYAERSAKFELQLRDRVLIFEDRQNGGRFSSRRVFTDEVQRLTSIEVGYGGLWLMCPPQLLFIPDRNGDGVPDGPAEVILDGFTVPAQSYHNFANGLRFGPDGWLYGRCGASAPGRLGRPGTSDEQRVPLHGTMWRYEPRRKVVEVLSSGTTNPWGHDWDENGELFFINTVNGHLWHGITGAHFVAPFDRDPNPYSYELIDFHADHWHFNTSADWTASRDGAANDFGGGHAHVGMMIYQGDNWPAEFRGRLFTLNFHGRRANQDILERTGSGYVGHHGRDFLLSDDPWFRGIEIGSGPDGGVFVLDWSDTGECHNALGVNRTSGRIYKIVHGQAHNDGPGNLQAIAPEALVAALTHANQWVAVQARLELTTRAAAGEDLTPAVRPLRALLAADANPVVQLRALWTLHALRAADRDLLLSLLRQRNEHIRTWAVRLLTDDLPLDLVSGRRPRTSLPTALDPAVREAFVALAGSDDSGLVRLALASALQRLEGPDRIVLAKTLARHREDGSDHNLPLMIWYGISPLGDSTPLSLAEIATGCELPTTRRLIARRLAENLGKDAAPLETLLAAAARKPAEFQADIVAGMAEGLQGWRQAPRPAGWDTLAAGQSGTANATLRRQVQELNLIFGDGRAIDDLRAVALDAKADVAARQLALETLIESRVPDLRAVCERLLAVPHLNTVAVRGLARFEDPILADKIVQAYRSIEPEERGSVVGTLASRPSFARALLRGVNTGLIPRSDLSPFHVRQILGFNDADLSRLLEQVWGELRAASADKQAVIARYRAELTSTVLAGANRSRGRTIFARTCAACHRLHGEGGNIGPDLTGAGRDNLDYLLDNIVDPSGVVPADFRLTTIRLKDGRTVSGFIAARTAKTLSLRTLTETIVVERDEVVAQDVSSQSMMPEGLLDTLGADERRDLIAYLRNPVQVPLP